MATHYPILFTAEHASEVLSRIRPAVDEMVLAVNGLRDLAPAGRTPGEILVRNGGSRPAPEALALMGSLQQALVTIRSEGVLVKDASIGLLDFPAVREGKLVFLCWMHGEGEIGFWHDPQAGFSGRQPLDG
jgi:hypothetical protein